MEISGANCPIEKSDNNDQIRQKCIKLKTESMESLIENFDNDNQIREGRSGVRKLEKKV